MHPAQWVTRFKAISRLIQLGRQASELAGKEILLAYADAGEDTRLDFSGACVLIKRVWGQPVILYFSNAPQGMPAGWALRLLSQKAVCHSS